MQEATHAKRWFEILFNACVTSIDETQHPSSMLLGAFKKSRPPLSTSELVAFFGESMCHSIYPKPMEDAISTYHTAIVPLTLDPNESGVPPSECTTGAFCSYFTQYEVGAFHLWSCFSETYFDTRANVGMVGMNFATTIGLNGAKTEPITKYITASCAHERTLGGLKKKKSNYHSLWHAFRIECVRIYRHLVLYTSFYSSRNSSTNLWVPCVILLILGDTSIAIGKSGIHHFLHSATFLSSQPSLSTWTSWRQWRKKIRVNTC